MSSNQTSSPPEPPKRVRGILADYDLIEPIGSGGSGQAFRARTVNPSHETAAGETVVVKIPLLRPDLAFGEAREAVDRINRSLATEILLRSRLKRLDCVAHVVDHGQTELPIVGGDMAIPATFAVQRFVEGDRLDHFVAKAGRQDAKSFFGVTDVDTYFELGMAIARSLRAIHQEQIVHGDVWFRNVIVSSGRAVFIDFGKSALKDLSLPRRTEERESGRFRPPEGRGSVKGDIHDLGGLLYYLATGDDVPPDHIRDNDALKHAIADGIKARNRPLYGANSGVVDVIARCRRYEQYERYHTVENVMQDLETFGAPQDGHLPADQVLPLLVTLDRSPQALFARLARLRLRTECRHLEDMVQGVYDLVGDHEDIVTGFMQYLSALGPGDQYLTLSVPAFWRRNNLGVNGRVLTMTKIAAQRGAVVRRVFLTTPEDREDPEVVQIIRAHVAIAEEFLGQDSDQGEAAASVGGGYQVGFVQVSDEFRREFVEQRNHFGLLISGESHTIAAPVYTLDERLVGVEFRAAPGFTQGKRRLFDDWLARARPLPEFFGA